MDSGGHFFEQFKIKCRNEDINGRYPSLVEAVYKAHSNACALFESHAQIHRNTVINLLTTRAGQFIQNEDMYRVSVLHSCEEIVLN